MTTGYFPDVINISICLCLLYLVSLSLGQPTVRLYGQTDQILSQSFLCPAQRHQGLGLTNVAL